MIGMLLGKILHPKYLTQKMLNEFDSSKELELLKSTMYDYQEMYGSVSELDDSVIDNIIKVTEDTTKAAISIYNGNSGRLLFLWLDEVIVIKIKGKRVDLCCNDRADEPEYIEDVINMVNEAMYSIYSEYGTDIDDYAVIIVVDLLPKGRPIAFLNNSDID